MGIDVEHLSEEELLSLEQSVRERLKLLEGQRTPVEMRQFSLGEQVSFEPPGRCKQSSKVIKFYRRTVMIITESGQKWKVPPHLLKKAKRLKPKVRRIGKVIDLPFEHSR